MASSILYWETYFIHNIKLNWQIRTGKINQSYEYAHWDQQRQRAKHFDKITQDYWVSPELLSLR